MENANLLSEGGPENSKRIAGLILLQAAEARAEAAEAAALERQGAVEAARQNAFEALKGANVQIDRQAIEIGVH